MDDRQRYPTKQGLYDPAFEHDACGMGFVAHIGGAKSYDILDDALTVLENLSHRGASGSDEHTGDGAGVLFQIPHRFFRKEAQKEGQLITNDTASYQLQFTVPQQYQLLKEQTETQRAQTLNSRTDGAAVVGYVGKQKDLYSQQIDSYKRDAEIKAAKLVSDGWMTQKTIDEAALTPSSFQQNMVDAVLQVVKQRNGLS